MPFLWVVLLTELATNTNKDVAIIKIASISKKTIVNTIYCSFDIFLSPFEFQYRALKKKYVLSNNKLFKIQCSQKIDQKVNMKAFVVEKIER